MAVISHDDKVDPVGACVGMRGARVKNIVRELNNEKVDILEWTEDPVIFVREALSPVEPREITVDEEAKKIFVIVQDDQGPLQGHRPQGPERPPHLPPDGLGRPGARL